MSENRPIVLTIAGFDPSGGAGVLADIKTFEQHKVYGFAINTANTIQTENEFLEIQWTDLNFVLRSIQILFKTHPVKGVKIGIIPSLDYLKTIVFEIKKLSPETKIIWDTVLKSTTQFDFITIENQTILTDVLQKIDLITPNYDEIIRLSSEEIKPNRIAENLSRYCAVLLKGGHNPEEIGVDYLYSEKEVFRLKPKNILAFEKHGSGCVLSSAITANIALKQDSKTACTNAKKHIEIYLQSNQTKLGYHYVQQTTVCFPREHGRRTIE
jgi:hydroxymethylpyrimidine/phosphomethylpyrimidine kinase